MVSPVVSSLRACLTRERGSIDAPCPSEDLSPAPAHATVVKFFFFCVLPFVITTLALLHWYCSLILRSHFFEVIFFSPLRSFFLVVCWLFACRQTDTREWTAGREKRVTIQETKEVIRYLHDRRAREQITSWHFIDFLFSWEEACRLGEKKVILSYRLFFYRGPGRRRRPAAGICADRQEHDRHLDEGERMVRSR